MKKVWIGLVAAVAMTACGTQLPAPQEVTGSDSSRVVLSKRTKTLGTMPRGGLSAQAFRSVEQNITDLKDAAADFSSVTFYGSSAYARGLQPGDILSAPPNQVTPNGFLLKVLSVTDLGTDIVVGTEEADLDEAIEVADSEQEAALEQSDLVSVTYADGRTLTGAEIQGLRPQASATLGSFDVPIPSVALCNGVNGLGSFKARNLKVFLKIKFGFLKVKAIKTGISGTQEINMSVNGRCTSAINFDQPIARMTFGRRTFSIGPISVSVSPFYDIKLKANGTISGNLSLNVTQTINGPFGAHWKKSTGTEVLSEETTSHTMVSNSTPSSSGTFNLRTTIRGEAGLMFWARFVGVKVASATLFVFTEPYTELNAVRNGSTVFSLFAGADVGLGGRAKIFGKSVGSINFIQRNVFRSLVFSNDPNVGGAPAPTPTPSPRPQPCGGEHCQEP